MFKKLLALLTVLSLLVCFAACSKDETVSKNFGGNDASDSEDKGDALDFDFDTTEDAEVTIKDTEDQDDDSNSGFSFDFGDTASDCWENESVGLGFRLPDNWSFSTDEEIEAINGFATSQLSDSELLSNLDENSVVYDMMASDDNLSGSNINVLLQKVPGVGSSDIKAVVEEIAKTYKSELKTQMAEMGFDMKAFNTTTFNVGGVSIPGIESEYTMQGVSMLQRQLYFKAGSDHACIITLTAMSESDMEMIFDNLYTL